MIPGLTDICKHFLSGPIFRGLIYEGLMFGRTFGLKGDLHKPIISAFDVQSERERVITTLNA